MRPHELPGHERTPRDPDLRDRDPREPQPRDLALHERSLLGPIEPFEAWRRLHGAAPSVLLDGPAGGGGLARRAYVLFDPYDVVVVPAGSDLRRDERTGDPLDELFARLPRAPAGALPSGRFRGGAAGFLSYDLGRWFERIPATAVEATAMPDLWFGLFDRGLEIDLATGAGTLFVLEGAAARGVDRLDPARVLEDAEARLASPAPLLGAARAGPLRSNFSRPEYEAAVEAVREHIRAGDVYQVNLSQRFEAPFEGDPAALYARLRSLNPAPFPALVDTGAGHVLSSSPERFVSLRGRAAETRPIKGTRRRGATAEEDAARAAELEGSEKDRAELAMIVDLERNDLGRVAEVGSVRVVSGGHVEAFATVLHRVAVVRATLRADAGPAALLRAAFPGGSITGAPRIRAMEVVEALERSRRGVFTGSIGWIGCHGDLDLNIAIRTLVVEGDVAHFHVGGGVTLDSCPAAEYDETLAKGEALARALGSPLV